MFPIRPGNLTCAGLVVIFLVLPNSIWKGADAKFAPLSPPKVDAAKRPPASHAPRVKFREVLR